MSERISILKQSAMAAGDIVKKALPSEGIREKEGRANIVTAADLASEKIIMDIIKANFPDDPILSEETQSNLGDLLSLDKLWVIDPIDGTNNFRYQRNYSAISIGYVEKGVVQAGAIFDPFREDLYYAEKGKGAFLNGEKISVGTNNDLGKASVITDNSYDPAGTRHNLELLLKLPITPWVMMKGSAVLEMSEVASGRADLFFHTFLKPWDNAAAFILTEEAGGVVIGIDGRPVNFLTSNAIVGNQELVNQFLQAVL